MSKQGTRIVATLVVALVAGLLPLAGLPAAATPAWCTDVVDAAQAPEQISPRDCDLAGRTVTAAGLEVLVPPPGQGRSAVAMTRSGEITLEVETGADGVVAVRTGGLEETSAAPTTRTAAAYVAGGDSFASAVALPVPRTFMPSVGQSFDLASATLQPGEPTGGCGEPTAGSLWYRIQRPGTLRRIELRADVPLALYRGTSLDALQREACIPAHGHEQLVTIASTGVYYLQVAVTKADLAAGKLAAHVWLTNGEMRPEGTPPCDSRLYQLVPDTVARSPLKWRFNAGSTPGSLTKAQALRGIQEGLAVITQSRNDCGMSDQVSARQEYLGTTSKPASMCTTGSDRVNVIAFGPAPAGMLGLACNAWTINARGKAVVFESDVRLTKGETWTLQPDDPRCNGAIDLVAVTAHEVGHVFGLDHAIGTRGLNLTMSTSASACNGAARTLGRGDVLALRQRY